jgi:RNA polymerase sigma-70 factor (ECF subfamily)
MTVTGVEQSQLEARFGRVFEHFGFIVEYARRRGSGDPEGLAAEAISIAWRGLADVPEDDPRPWVIGVARNLLLAERRHAGQIVVEGPEQIEALNGVVDLPVVVELDSVMEVALRNLSLIDREALLLVAWEELSPAEAARSLRISAGAFRVRLHRARRRLIAELARHAGQSSLAGAAAKLEIS